MEVFILRPVSKSKWIIMENDDRDRDDVPESWEEASEKPIQALESKIEEAKLKNRQQQQLQQQQNVR